MMLEDPELPMILKSSRLMVEDNSEPDVTINSRTLSPVLLGAKSRIGRETDGLKNISGNGMDLFALTSKEEETKPGIGRENDDKPYK